MVEKFNAKNREEILFTLLRELPDVGEILAELYRKSSGGYEQKGKSFDHILNWIIGSDREDMLRVKDTLEKNFDHIIKDPIYLDEVLKEHEYKQNKIREGEEKSTSNEPETKAKPGPMNKAKELLEQGEIHEAKQVIEEFIKDNPSNSTAITLDYEIQKAIDERSGPSAHTIATIKSS